MKLLVQISGAKQVLEVGVFTGYSSCSLALGLPEDGRLTALEVRCSCCFAELCAAGCLLLSISRVQTHWISPSHDLD